jgi:RimJ/RimL family protein N-acetyltransferase
MLKGTYTRLRVLDEADAEYVRRLRNSPAVANFFQSRHFISDVQQREFVAALARTTERIFFIAERLPAHTPFGVYCLQEIDHRNQRAELGFFLDEAAQATGVEGFEAAYLLLDYAFGYLNLHKVWAEVLPENARGIRFEEGLGMQREAVRQQHLYYEGDFHDLLIYALFRSDFYDKLAPTLRPFRRDRGENPLAGGADA